jgi:hypothetical protein
MKIYLKNIKMDTKKITKMAIFFDGTLVDTELQKVENKYT